MSTGDQLVVESIQETSKTTKGVTSATQAVAVMNEQPFDSIREIETIFEHVNEMTESFGAAVNKFQYEPSFSVYFS